MKILLRICVISSVVLGLALLAHGQQGPTRAEFDCLMMSKSSGVAAPGELSKAISFHHVWTPNLNYGYFQSHGVNLHYETEGEGGEVVIVVHGGPGLPHEYFHPMLSSLGRYTTLVYFDRRADILSSRGSFEVLSLSDMADDIEALRKALGLNRVTLLGHSFGGAIALTYALAHPDNVKRLILVSTTATIENPVEAEKRILETLTPAESSAYYSNEGSTAGAASCDRVRKRYRVLYPHYFHKSPDKEMLERGVYSVYFDSLAKKLVLASETGGFDVRAELGRIKAPSLVIAGRHDKVTPLAGATEMAESLPNSRIAVMEQSGHFPFFEENYLFTEWIRRFILATTDAVDDRTQSPVVVSAASNSR